MTVVHVNEENCRRCVFFRQLTVFGDIICDVHGYARKGTECFYFRQKQYYRREVIRRHE